MFQKLLRMPRFLRLVSFIMHALHIDVLHTRRVVLVFSFKRVREVLRRDNDFRVAPLYQEKMRAVAGDFFLGLDRCPLSYRQRDYSTRAMATATQDLQDAITEAADAALDGAGETFDVISQYARPIACQSAIRLFGVRAPNDAQLMGASRAVFHQVFLTLTKVDPEIAEAGKAGGARLRRWCLDEIDRRRRSGARPEDFLSYLMARPDMRDEDRATVIAGHLVGAIETTATAFGYIAYEILSNNRLHEIVREDKDDLERLRGWAYDILRKRPQAPFLPRRTANPVELGGKWIPENTLVLAVTSAAHYDPNVFIKPDTFAPDRPQEDYLHFGGGPHMCAGRAVNDLQIPLLLQRLFAQYPRGCEKLVYDGPFPDELRVRFKRAA